MNGTEGNNTMNGTEGAYHSFGPDEKVYSCQTERSAVPRDVRPRG